MPTPLEANLYRLGVRLGQCRSLHLQCTQDSDTNAGDVGVLNWAIGSLEPAFAAFAAVAELSEPRVKAGRSLISHCKRLWKRWAKLSTEQLLDLYGEDWEYRRDLDSLEELLCDVVGPESPVMGWFHLGRQLVDGRWHDPNARPGVGWRRGAKPQWKWADESEVHRLLESTNLSMEQVFPELPAARSSAALFPHVGNRYQPWERIETGLSEILKHANVHNTAAAIPGTSPDSPTKCKNVTEVKWEPDYLGLQFDFGQFRVKREGRVPVSLSRIPWELLLILGQAKESYVADKALKEAWAVRGKTPQHKIIVAALHDLKESLAALGVGIENKRDKGWRLVEIVDAPQA